MYSSGPCRRFVASIHFHKFTKADLKRTAEQAKYAASSFPVQPPATLLARFPQAALKRPAEQAKSAASCFPICPARCIYAILTSLRKQTCSGRPSKLNPPRPVFPSAPLAASMPFSHVCKSRLEAASRASYVRRVLFSRLPRPPTIKNIGYFFRSPSMCRMLV